MFLWLWMQNNLDLEAETSIDSMDGLYVVA